LGLEGDSVNVPFSCNVWIPLFAPLTVVPASVRAQNFIDGNASDGILGGRWFDGSTWTWDYAKGKLLWRSSNDVYVEPLHTVALGFQRSRGAHATGFPRIGAVVDGQRLNFLLDTGAHTLVNALAVTQWHFPATPFATSFIERSIFDRWHKAHPEWPYVADGEIATHAPMIRVPEVEIAGYAVGPAWFTARPDKNFATFMSQFMDEPVVGAIGGSVLHFFRLTVDYTGERAYFER
jgi:hypothetical protein